MTFALALLLVAVAPDDPAAVTVPLPGAVRLEIVDSVSTNGGPPVVTKQALEAAVAADGSFRMRVVDGDRNRFLAGTVESRRDRFGFDRHFVRFQYLEYAENGAVPVVGGGMRPVYDVTRYDSFMSLYGTGEPLTWQGGGTESQTETEHVLADRAFTLVALDKPTPLEVPEPKGSEAQFNTTLPVPIP